MENGQPSFPNAPYVFGEAEFDYWKAGKNIPERRVKNRELFIRYVVPFAEKATFLKPGQDVVSGVQAVDAFGHSPGMLAFHIESEGIRLFLWANVTNHYVMSLMKPEWHVLFDHDKEGRRNPQAHNRRGRSRTDPRGRLPHAISCGWLCRARRRTLSLGPG